MTGIVIVTAAIVLLIAALAPAHRRSTTPWHPGADLSVDADHRRLTEDLTAVAQRRYGPLAVLPVFSGRLARPYRSTGPPPDSPRADGSGLRMG